MLEVNKSQLWAAVTGVTVFMLGFRSKQAWGRFWEGTGLLHQMRGEWFDTVSNCVTFSIAAKTNKSDQVMDFRHTIIRIMSLCHGSALEEIAGNKIELESIDCFGLNDDTLHHLMDCHVNYHFNKVEVMLHMLQSLITKALDDGILKVPPPILSRVYQTISRGFVNLLNAKKITDTKFPFPYTQLITILLFLLEFLCPLMMTTILRSKVICTCFAFLPIFGLFSLNFIAQELEDPFGDDANDLPLAHFQTEMNNCLMMLLHPNSDIIAGIGPRCESDFHSLISQIRTSDLDSEEDSTEEGSDGRKTKRLSQFDISRPMSSFFEQDSEAEDRHESESGGNRDNSGAPERVSRKSQVPFPGSPGKSAPTNLVFKRASVEAICGKRASTSEHRRFGQVEEEAPDTNDASSSALTGTADASKIASELDALALDVAQEPLARERTSPEELPRMEPMLLLNSTTSESIRSIAALNGSHDVAIQEIGRIANLQPMLAKNMDALILDLQQWTLSVHREVDNLNQNSTVLQNALQRFGDGLPELRRQTGHANGTTNMSPSNMSPRSHNSNDHNTPI